MIVLVAVFSLFPKHTPCSSRKTQSLHYSLSHFLGDVFLLHLPLRGVVLLPCPRTPAGRGLRGNRLHVLPQGVCG